MGFSVSAATAIIFSAMAFSMGILAIMVSEAFDSVRQGGETRVEMLVERERTNIAFVDVGWANGTLHANISNSGSTTLHISKTSLVLNGFLVTSGLTADIGGLATDLWLPGEVLHLRIAPAPAPSALKVVAENGASAYW
jgi:flagellar protein FlaF